ncbi:MAG: trypsin-like serine protease [Pseudobdellovibrionaceae bacterium]
MISKNLFAVAALLLSLTACSQRQAPTYQGELSTGVVGGQEVDAKDETAVSTVGLLILVDESSNSAICTGTLIEENIVITAAHCLVNFEEDGTVSAIRGGAVVFATDMTKADAKVARPFVKISIHPQFSPREPGQGGWNDIGLVKFEGPLPEGYKPASRLTDVSQLTKGLSVVFAGYGITSPEGQHAVEDDSGVLRRADSVLTDGKHEGSELLFELPPSKVSTCQGDSGGPAYARINGQLTLIGVTSRGSDERCDSLSVSTSVAAHVDYISKTLTFLKSSTAFH